MIDIKELSDCGIDVEEGLNRFMNNEALYLKFLGRFKSDTSFDELKKQMDNKEYEEAFKTAHSLKGMTGNLSINSLYKAICPLVEKLRANDPDGIYELYDNAYSIYKKVLIALESI